jgi:tetratricopeptide (TPR) repeat protein
MKRSILSLAVFLILMLAVSACGGGGSDLTYKIVGTAAEAKVVYTNAQGETESETVSLPWETAFGIGGDFDFKINVENASESGSVTCEIWINELRVGGTSGVRRAECSGSFSGSKNAFSTEYRGRYDAAPEDAVVTMDEQDAAMATSVAATENRKATQTAEAMPSPTPTAPPAAPAATLAPITEFDTYEHDMDCLAYNDELNLRAFSVRYPSGSVIKDCSENSENYVLFEFEPDADTEDAALLIALGRFNLDPPDSSKYRTDGMRMLTTFAGQIERQLDAETLESDPLVYQGETLYHRDMVAEVEGTRRLLRAALIPNFEHGHGLLFFAVQKIAGTPEEEMPAFDEMARQVIESVAFAPLETRIGFITFAGGLTAEDDPIDPTTRFPAGIKEVYGVFEYADLYPGMAFGFTWLRDGETIYSDSVTWAGEASSGRTWVSVDNDEGLDAGNYVLRLFVNETLLQAGNFVIEGETGKADAGTWYEQGLARYRAGDYEGAIEAFSMAIELKPEVPPAYSDRGATFIMLGDYERAVADFDAAIALDPDYARAYNNRGWAYYKLGDYAQALADLDQAIELDPNSAQAYFNRANVYEAQGDLEAAIADYGQSIAVDPRDVFGASRGYLNRGLAYAKQGEFELAISDYNQALALRPDWDLAYLDRGLAYGKAGDTERAIADLHKALEISENPNVRQMAEENLEALGETP